MAEINLLKQKPSGSSALKSWTSVAAKLLTVVLVAVLAYYGWLFYRLHQIGSQIASTTSQITQAQAAALSLPGRSELLTRQQQLAALQGVVSSHLYWSRIFPALANVTLKSASYSDITVNPDGTLELAVRVPNISELDKFLQIFDLPAFNSNFSNVTVGSFHSVQSGNSATAVEFDMQLTYNPALLGYQPGGQ